MCAERPEVVCTLQEANMMIAKICRLIGDEDGMTAVEYALLLAVVVVAGVAAWQGLDLSIHNATERTGAGMATN